MIQIDEEITKMKLATSLRSALLLSLAFLTGCISGPSCGELTGGSGTPSLAFTYVPPLGSTDSLRGQELHVTPINYYVAVYIHVGSEGWWTKPTFDDPETTINCDGSWSADITTGGDDQKADRIAAFLLPQGFVPPQLGGESVLPQALYTNSIASAAVAR